MTVATATKWIRIALGTVLMLVGTTLNVHAYEIWVTNQRINKVQVIDGGSLKVIAEIEAGVKPHTITFSPHGERAYVANIRSNDFTVIDAGSRKPVRTVPAGKLAHHVAVSPDDQVLLVTDRNAHAVTLYDARSFARLKTIPVRPRPTMAVFTPDGKKAYVTSTDDVDRLTGETGYSRRPTLSVIDAAKMEVVGTIPIPGDAAMALAITPDGQKVIVVGDDKYSIVETATGTVIAAGMPGKDARSVALTPDNRYGLIANRLSNDVAIVDVASGTLVGTIANVGDKPSMVDVAPDGKRAFVTLIGQPAAGDPPDRVSGADAGVAVIDLASKKVITILRLGGDPAGLAVKS